MFQIASERVSNYYSSFNLVCSRMGRGPCSIWPVSACVNFACYSSLSLISVLYELEILSYFRPSLKLSLDLVFAPGARLLLSQVSRTSPYCESWDISCSSRDVLFLSPHRTLGSEQSIVLVNVVVQFPWMFSFAMTSLITITFLGRLRDGGHVPPPGKSSNNFDPETQFLQPPQKIWCTVVSVDFRNQIYSTTSMFKPGNSSPLVFSPVSLLVSVRGCNPGMLIEE